MGTRQRIHIGGMSQRMDCAHVYVEVYKDAIDRLRRDQSSEAREIAEAAVLSFRGAIDLRPYQIDEALVLHAPSRRPAAKDGS